MSFHQSQVHKLIGYLSASKDSSIVITLPKEQAIKLIIEEPLNGVVQMKVSHSSGGTSYDIIIAKYLNDQWIVVEPTYNQNEDRIRQIVNIFNEIINIQS